MYIRQRCIFLLYSKAQLVGEISGTFFGMTVNVYLEVTSFIMEKVSKRRLGIYSRYIVL